MDIGRILCLGSIPMSLVSVIFFVYSNIGISDVKEGFNNDICKDYFLYNLTYIGLFLFSLLVFILFLCCGRCLASIFFVLNSVLIVSQMVEVQVKKDERCDSICQVNCTDLVEVNDRINMALIINSIIIGLTGLFITGNIVKKCFCGKSE